jgi:hypothetical protein
MNRARRGRAIHRGGSGVHLGQRLQPLLARIPDARKPRPYVPGIGMISTISTHAPGII